MYDRTLEKADVWRVAQGCSGGAVFSYGPWALIDVLFWLSESHTHVRHVGSHGTWRMYLGHSWGRAASSSSLLRQLYFTAKVIAHDLSCSA